eukprot:99097-Chlamydomonas_euryale.AAC.3
MDVHGRALHGDPGGRGARNSVHRPALRGERVRVVAPVAVGPYYHVSRHLRTTEGHAAFPTSRRLRTTRASPVVPAIGVGDSIQWSAADKPARMWRCVAGRGDGLSILPKRSQRMPARLAALARVGGRPGGSRPPRQLAWPAAPRLLARTAAPS